MLSDGNKLSPMKADRFSQMGIAALLPGMQFMIDEMQEVAARLRQTLYALQDDAPKRRGRPPGSGKAVAGITTRGTPAKLHPRDPRHPEHEAWAEMMSKAQKKRWNNLSAAARKKQIAKMTAGTRRAHRQVQAVNGAA